MKVKLCAFLIIAVSATVAPLAGAEEFVTNIIDFAGCGNSVSLAVDNNNAPLLVYRKQSLYTSGPLYLASAEQGNYSFEQITGSENSLYFSDIEVTSNDELAVCFQQRASLFYATKGSWFDWTTTDTGLYGACVFMAMSDNDVPHIAYTNNQYYVFHAYFDIQQGWWISELLSGIPSGGSYPYYAYSIDVAADGRVAIAAANPSPNSDVYVAVKESTGWKYLPTFEGYCPSIAFTPDGKIAVAYYQGGGSLAYSVYVNDFIGWVDSEVDHVGPCYWPKLAISGTGVPGIAYAANGEVKYATNIAGGWTTTVLDANCSAFQPDLIFDKNDNPLIAYSAYDDCLGSVMKLCGIDLEPYCMADFDNDHCVDFLDFANFAADWLAETEPPLPSDLNKDGIVNWQDYRIFLCFWMWDSQ